MIRKPIKMHGTKITPVFGGQIEQVDGVAVEVVGDRFYIGFAQPGFNSPANNRSGYKSRAAAAAACHKYNNR